MSLPPLPHFGEDVYTITGVSFTFLIHSIFPVLHLCSAQHQAKQGDKHLRCQDPGEVKPLEKTASTHTGWGRGSPANTSRRDAERMSGRISTGRSWGQTQDTCLQVRLPTVPLYQSLVEPCLQPLCPYATVSGTGPCIPLEGPAPYCRASGGSPAASPSASAGQGSAASKHSHTCPLCSARGILFRLCSQEHLS